jgi:hypothetical protein
MGLVPVAGRGPAFALLIAALVAALAGLAGVLFFPF